MKQFLLLVAGILFSASVMATVSITSQTNVSCPGICNGAVTLSITGGTMPYTVSSLGASSSCFLAPYPPFSSSTITINGLCACTYSLLVKDVTATTIGTVVVTITSPPPIVNSFSVQNVCCNGSCNGVISDFLSGGTPPYMYSWFPPGPSGPTYTGACAGTYDLCVTDGNGCTKCFTTQVNQPPVFSITSSVTAASCGTCCNGMVNVSGTGGQPGYSYTIFPGSMSNASGTFSNLCSGSYSVCGSDAGCCMTCIGVTIPASPTSVRTLASKDSEVFIYPNPSHGTLYIRSLADLSEATYDIHDMLGKKIDSGNVEEFSKMSPLQDGVYFITIRNKDCTVISRKKIIVEK